MMLAKASRFASGVINPLDARFALEWDFDGNGNYEGNPYYIFCDTGGGQSYLSIRGRYDDFGAGFGLDRSGGPELSCNALQLSWHYEVLGICAISCLILPWFKANGGMSVSYQAPFPVAEVLYAGKWWRVPNKLVIS